MARDIISCRESRALSVFAVERVLVVASLAQRVAEPLETFVETVA